MASLRILVVDDDPAVVQILLRSLNKAGFQAFGYTTVAKAKEAKGPWDLLLVDINLPDGDGREILNHHQRAGIVISGDPEPGPHPIVVPAKFLRKPFTITELLNTIRSMLPQ